jgi:hypothetical protein
MRNDGSGSSKLFSFVARMCLLAGGLAVTQGTAAAEQVDPVKHRAGQLELELDVWETVGGRTQVKAQYVDYTECTSSLEQMGELDPEGTATIEVEHDIPGLKAGRHSWRDARPACDAIVVAVAQHTLIANFRRTAGSTDEGSVNACIRSYEAAIKGGVAPTEVVKIDEGDGAVTHEVTAPMLEHYQKCVAARTKLNGKKDALEGPYRKVLKNDKLATVLDRMGFIYLPGGVDATPATLAANNVWFTKSVSDNLCPNGLKTTTLYRYQFNAQHKLVKNSHRDYCGSPPGSAYK